MMDIEFDDSNDSENTFVDGCASWLAVVLLTLTIVATATLTFGWIGCRNFLACPPVQTPQTYYVIQVTPTPNAPTVPLLASTSAR